jgi:Ca2+-binding RTX toxin-like protein
VYFGTGARPLDCGPGDDILRSHGSTVEGSQDELAAERSLTQEYPSCEHAEILHGDEPRPTVFDLATNAGRRLGGSAPSGTSATAARGFHRATGTPGPDRLVVRSDGKSTHGILPYVDAAGHLHVILMQHEPGQFRSERDLLLGRDGDDLLDGGAGDDHLEGENGDDRLEGGRGSDLLRGGDGGDVLNGGLDADVLTGGCGQRPDHRARRRARPRRLRPGPRRRDRRPRRPRAPVRARRTPLRPSSRASHLESPAHDRS